MKTGKKLLTGTLSVLCAALLVLCSVLAIGWRWSKAAKTNAAALPEVRNNGTAIQWKYSDETDWRDLVALAELTGAAGENGKNGTDGKDGSNGADGKNGIDTFIQRNAEDDFSVIVGYDKLEEKGYSFSAGQYFEVKIEYVDITAEEFEAKMNAYKESLAEKFNKGHALEESIMEQIGGLFYEND